MPSARTCLIPPHLAAIDVSSKVALRFHAFYFDG